MYFYWRDAQDGANGHQWKEIVMNTLFSSETFWLDGVNVALGMTLIVVFLAVVRSVFSDLLQRARQSQS